MVDESAPPAVDGGSRLGRHAVIADALALSSDRDLRERLRTAAPLAAGIGGETSLLRVADAPVFVKCVPLTALEQRGEHVRSTADLFGLPPWHHYGVGSAGVGAWRELAAHVLTSGWVADGTCESFPLLHHWRVLSNHAAPAITAEQRAELESSVDFWHQDPSVRRRLEALASTPDRLVLFVEHIPQNLLTWLGEKAAHGGAALDSACARVEEDLLAAAAHMASSGLVHFDAHLRNVLADDERLYVSDFGLACSTSFDLTDGERDLLRTHVDHDVAYVATEIVNWIVVSLTRAALTWTHPQQRNDFVERCAHGHVPPELPPSAAAAVQRFAPVAAIMNAFYFELHGTSRQTPYPAAALRQACEDSGIGVAGPRRADARRRSGTIRGS